MSRVAAIFFCCVVTFAIAAASFAQTRTTLALPEEVSKKLDEVMRACRENKRKTIKDQEGLGFFSDRQYDLPTGVAALHLDDNDLVIVVDAWRACEERIKGNGVCSTGGCELIFIKRNTDGTWDKIFSEVAYGNYFVSSSPEGNFFALIISIRGGASDDSTCGSQFGRSCDYLYRRADGKWQRERLR